MNQPTQSTLIAAALAGAQVSAQAASSNISVAQAARFLAQATFGPRLNEISDLLNSGYQGWLTQQFNQAPTSHLGAMLASGDQLTRDSRLAAWWNIAVNGRDQLRQRVAFALIEIFVVSDQSAALSFESGNALAYYYDLLVKNAFGNFRSLLEDVTLSPAMGLYLNMKGNQKPDPANNIHADENYARELMQLFSIGLVQLNIDGTVKLDAKGVAQPTYSQTDVENLARVLTGWSWAGGDFFDGPPNNLTPMAPFAAYHDTDPKSFLGLRLPAGGSASQELKAVLDLLYIHPNVGPFFCRQLIQRLVSSNPSPAYVGRVASVFNNNGAGIRGDLKAVVQAILLDSEARNDPGPTFGKLREPVLQVTHLWRACNAKAPNGRYEFYYPESEIGQAPLSSPTVFNFFRPNYAPPGKLKTMGLAAPEMQLVNAASVAQLNNRMADFVFGRDKDLAQNPEPSDILLDLTPFKANAVNNLPALFDQLNLLFMSGQMSTSMKAALQAYLTTVGTDDGGSSRVQEALYLIMTSSQYMTQK